ncbi:MAG: glycerophosphodiester phosphodiesterase [Actinomycetaceae bacterium]|nr:glycerophosphodiester phosphodiesterase [Actinomycetaceae bacterium]
MMPVARRGGPLIFAHRGGTEYALENTWEAFDYARSIGVTHCETDAHLSADGVVVIHHDDTLECTFGIARAISDMRWEELQDVRGRGGERILRLSDALQSFPDLYFNIDAKSNQVAVPLVDELRICNALDRTLVASFSESRLQHLRRYEPALSTSLGTTAVARLLLAAQSATRPERWCVPGPANGVRAVQVPPIYSGIPVVTPRFIATAHQAGLAVHVWTINDPVQVQQLLAMRVDGIVTDRPTMVRDIVGA